MLFAYSTIRFNNYFLSINIVFPRAGAEAIFDPENKKHFFV